MKRKILITLAFFILLPVLVVVALFAMRERPDGPRVEAASGVVGVEAGGAYAWIVRTSHGAVLIDAGLDATGAAILTELKAEDVEPGEVRAVLITHGHPDHYAAAGLFQKATVVVGSSDLAMIRGDTTHYSTFGKIIGAVMPLPPAPRVVTAVHDNEQLEFDGARFKVVGTPGHTPGSVMYLYNDVLTYKDLDGVFHSVEVTAESVYEASVLALSALSKHEWIESVGPGTRLEIQVLEPGVTHLLLVAQLRQWLDQPTTSPAESVRKRKLKALLAS